MTIALLVEALPKITRNLDSDVEADQELPMIEDIDKDGWVSVGDKLIVNQFSSTAVISIEIKKEHLASVTSFQKLLNGVTRTPVLLVDKQTKWDSEATRIVDYVLYTPSNNEESELGVGINIIVTEPDALSRGFIMDDTRFVAIIDQAASFITGPDPPLIPRYNLEIKGRTVGFLLFDQHNSTLIANSGLKTLDSKQWYDGFFFSAAEFCYNWAMQVQDVTIDARCVRCLEKHLEPVANAWYAAVSTENTYNQFAKVLRSAYLATDVATLPDSIEKLIRTAQETWKTQDQLTKTAREWKQKLAEGVCYPSR